MMIQLGPPGTNNVSVETHDSTATTDKSDRKLLHQRIIDYHYKPEYFSSDLQYSTARFIYTLQSDEMRSGEIEMRLR